MAKDEDVKKIDTSDKKAEEGKKEKEAEKDDKGIPLSASDVKLILRYGKGPYNE